MAQLLWQRHREQVAGLVLAATAYRFVNGARERFIFSSAMATAIGTTRTGALLTRAPVASMRRWAPRGHAARPTDLRAWAAGEMRRHDAIKVMEAGQAIGSYNARRWIADVDVPTTVLVTDRDRAIQPSEQLKLAEAIPGAHVQHLDEGHVACAKAVFGPAVVQAVDSVAARISQADHRIA